MSCNCDSYLGFNVLGRGLLLVALLLLGACASMPRTQDIPVANTPHTIYFIYRGWHTSLLIEAKTLAAYSPFLAPDLRGQRYGRVGFGDGDYFTGKSKSVGSATRALFASRSSALQLLGYDYEPFAEIPAETRVPLAISDAGMRRLIDHINKSIALDDKGMPLRMAAMGDAMGDFYLASTHYSAFSNCNTWSGQALRAAGLPVANRLTASGVFEQAQAISRVQAQAGLFSSPRRAISAQ
jgi:uncharacterized protein (TIGR02117 family)